MARSEALHHTRQSGVEQRSGIHPRFFCGKALPLEQALHGAEQPRIRQNFHTHSMRSRAGRYPPFRRLFVLKICEYLLSVRRCDNLASS